MSPVFGDPLYKVPTLKNGKIHRVIKISNLDFSNLKSSWRSIEICDRRAWWISSKMACLLSTSFFYFLDFLIPIDSRFSLLPFQKNPSQRSQATKSAHQWDWRAKGIDKFYSHRTVFTDLSHSIYIDRVQSN